MINYYFVHLVSRLNFLLKCRTVVNHLLTAQRLYGSALFTQLECMS